MTSGYYDRKGSLMTVAEFCAAIARREYQRVAETTLTNGLWVSTVWLGLDHSFGFGPPLIFETMVFPSRENMSELDCDRYSTEFEARLGHARLCQKWSR
jgi:hypothetical protein